MKEIFLLLIVTLFATNVNCQTCDDMMEMVRSEDYGTTLYSYNSSAISKVSFHMVWHDYEKYYFAIVCFKNGYTCNEYIYQVSSMTFSNYLQNYQYSAGKAFWEYIQPYNYVLGCAPEL